MTSEMKGACVNPYENNMTNTYAVSSLATTMATTMETTMAATMATRMQEAAWNDLLW